MKWKLLSEIPKDGRKFLAYDLEEGFVISWYDKDGFFDCTYGVEVEPIGWTELPNILDLTEVEYG